MDLKKWVGRFLRREEQQRPGFIVTNDLWNELWNLIIKQGDYNTETLTQLITEFLAEKERTKSMLLATNIKGGVNVSVQRDTNTNDIIIHAIDGGELPSDIPTVDTVTELINNAIIQYDTDTVQVITDQMQEQIDGKINTYSQDTDPALNWTDTPTQSKHTGDLWYNTTLQKTYRWSGSVWVELVDKDAQDAKTIAQSKVQFFLTQPTPPYFQGDLWNNELGLLYYCTTTKTTGSFNPSDWALTYKKLNDDLDTVATRVTQTESDIIQCNNDIALRVTQEEYANTQAATFERISEVEEKLTPEGIISVVSQTVEYQNLIANDSDLAASLAEVQAITQQNSTAIEQTNNQIEFRFNGTILRIEDLANVVDHNKTVIEEYIRFAGALIQLGRVGNDFTAELDNTKLSFKQNGVEIAYISNHKMYITDTEIKNKLTIGTTAKGYYDFIIKDNGNFALKWRNA